MKLAALAFPFALLLQQQPLPPSATSPQPRGAVILVTAGEEVETSASAAGGATAIGPAVVGGAHANSSTYIHSEVWDVVRHLSQDCPAATYVTNPSTPHTLTVHVDYERIHSLVVDRLYQLALLDANGNPLFVGKKTYLSRQIKPLCAAIQLQH